MEPIIRFENVHFTYPEGEREILCGIDLEIDEGSFVAVLGHNGSGKSTLAKHMNAILLPTEGRVLVAGLDTADEDKLLELRRTVGMVFQNPDNQIVANVVEDDVAFAPENLGVPPKEIRERVDAALKQVGMYDFRMHAPHLLCGKTRISPMRSGSSSAIRRRTCGASSRTGRKTINSSGIGRFTATRTKRAAPLHDTKNARTATAASWRRAMP